MRSIFGALLAAGLIVRADNIVSAYSDNILALAERLGDVGIDRNIAANVIANILAVDPDLGLVVASADVKEDAV